MMFQNPICSGIRLLSVWAMGKSHVNVNITTDNDCFDALISKIIFKK